MKTPLIKVNNVFDTEEDNKKYKILLEAVNKAKDFGEYDMNMCKLENFIKEKTRGCD